MSAHERSQGEAGAISCMRIARCELTISEDHWPFAEREAARIDAHWEQVRTARPRLFNGKVFLLRDLAVRDGVAAGTFVRAQFKSFVYWRERGYVDASVRDGFGSSVIRSAEGHVLLGLQGEGYLNAGRAYPPGGMIDVRDTAGGRVDIDASIARELAEETGLGPAGLQREPGYLLTQCGPLVSIAIEWRSALSAEALSAAILAHTWAQPSPELADVVIVRSADAIGDPRLPDYAGVLLRCVLRA
jgi:8-oxo-dGTP pyrophosphatase MutT (NUDIX family)